jgi:hypothetical protein
MTTTMVRGKAAQGTLANKTVTEICLDVSQAAQSECSIDGYLTADVVTWAIVMDPSVVATYPPPFQRSLIETPVSAAHCGFTAERLFSKLTTNARGTGVFTGLAQHVANAAKGRRRIAFHVRFLNHEFLIVVRNCQCELFQSFHGQYTLGQYLLRPSTPYPLALLQGYLNAIVMPEIQQQLFFSPLIGDARRAGYDYAVLKSDKEIWEALFVEAVPGVSCYLSLRCGRPFNEVATGRAT